MIETIYGITLIIACMIVVYCFHAHSIKIMQTSIRERYRMMDAEIQARQAILDKAFLEQTLRLQARDKEIDLLIADIPKRVNAALSNAVAQFVQPYQEMQEEFQGKGVMAMPNDDVKFEVTEAELQEALAKLEAGVL
jgi:hypothetical protein